MSDYNPPPIIINQRTNEGITDAKARITKMSGLVAELEVKLEAMYRVMLDQGIDPALFEAKIEEIMKEKAGPQIPVIESKLCPKCGMAVKRSANSPLYGKCMYCGASVPFNISFIKDEQKPYSDQS